MNEKISKNVFRQVYRCMMSLVGGSGHLASYAMLPDTFQISKVEELGRGLRKYNFTASAYYESEFTIYDQGRQPKAERIYGSIVLDKDLRLVKDEKGRVLLEPWSCINPLECDTDKGREIKG
jgi:hypothetical protein